MKVIDRRLRSPLEGGLHLPPRTNPGKSDRRRSERHLGNNDFFFAGLLRLLWFADWTEDREDSDYSPEFEDLDLDLKFRNT